MHWKVRTYGYIILSIVITLYNLWYESLALSYLEEHLDFRSVGHSNYQNFPTIGFPAMAYNKVNDDDPTTNT
jgi:hypothetical protein